MIRVTRLRSGAREAPRAGRRARPARWARRGMTLMEIMVALAIVLLTSAVLLSGLSGVMMLEQRNAARKIALMFEQLHDEAILRNKTFRIAFDVRQNKWHVEVGNTHATAFANQEQREAWEEWAEEAVEDMDPEELRAFREQQDFQIAKNENYDEPFELPANTFFKAIYTPQYEDPVTPPDPDRYDPDDEDAPPTVAYSHIFANGFVEFTIVQVADVNAPDEGFSIVVDPMSGHVSFVGELVEPDDAWEWLPDEGPELD